MHIPDGFINAPTSLAAGAVAAGGAGVSLRRAAQTLQERQAPLAGLVAAYIFAVQMLNFPVAAGTSGHLLGGVLAAVLVGPWAGCICVAVVLVVQSMLADGGLTALGLNITNMAVVGGFGGWAVFRLLRRVLPATKPSVVVSTGIAAGISVVLAASAFVVEYAVGGAGGAPVGTVLAAMVGVHTLIGIGEGIITALTVGVVLGVRPDLVYGASDLQAPLALRSQPGPPAGEVS
ncbi:MAG TPA: energy-coupling factor ABC transporter permease [Actinomycetota bacterium]|nr:energy-coupling factor ABC transporter permease [Actinomycetota bacterium]